MANIITQTELEAKFFEIIKAYLDQIRLTKLAKDYVELNLILIKMLSNLTSANVLWSKNKIYDSFIILRSAFESFVLFEYLKTFPENIEQYILDAEISRFKIYFGYYKHGVMKIDELTDSYLKLKLEAQKKLNLKINSSTNILEFNISRLEGKLHSLRPLNQKTGRMIEELLKKDKADIRELELFSLAGYRINSQFSHGDLYSIMDSFFTPDKSKLNEKISENIKECFRQSAYIIAYSIESITELLNLDNTLKQVVWDKIIQFYDYLGYDTKKIFADRIPKKSNIIDICNIDLNYFTHL